MGFRGTRFSYASYLAYVLNKDINNFWNNHSTIIVVHCRAGINEDDINQLENCNSLAMI